MNPAAGPPCFTPWQGAHLSAESGTWLAGAPLLPWQSAHWYGQSVDLMVSLRS
jgi:hypothetical protein